MYYELELFEQYDKDFQQLIAKKQFNIEKYAQSDKANEKSLEIQIDELNKLVAIRNNYQQILETILENYKKAISFKHLYKTERENFEVASLILKNQYKFDMNLFPFYKTKDFIECR